MTPLALWTRLVGWLRRRQLDQELEEEIATHLELARAENLRRGIAPEEARRLAAVRFGTVASAKEGVWEQRGLPGASSFLADFRYAFRGMRRNPGFTLVTVLTLALGVSLSSAWFSILNLNILRPLPGVADPSRLAAMQEQTTYPDFERYRDQGGVGQAAAFLARVPFGVAVAGPGNAEPERIFGHLVSPEYFPTLGLQPLLGRFFHSAVERPGAAPVVVVSERFWRTHLNSNSQVVGNALRVNGRQATIVGVAPKDFLGVFPSTAADIFVPLTTDPALAPELDGDILHRTTQPAVQVLFRLRPGITTASAEARLDAQARQIDEERNPARKQRGRLVHLMQAGNFVPLPADAKVMIVTFYAVLITLVLSLTCANLAGLILARGSARAREIAIRLSLGASRTRLIRQLLTESVSLAGLGGLVGLITASAFLMAVVRLMPGSNPAASDLTANLGIAIFAFGISALAGIGFGLLPALAVTRPDLAGMLKSGVQIRLGRFRRFGLRNLFVVYQVAAAMTLLLIMGFVLTSIQYGAKRNPGFDPARISLFSIDPARDGLTAEQSSAALAHLPERLSGQAGVESVALANQPPLTDANLNTSVAVLPAGTKGPESVHSVGMQSVGPGSFGTLGATLLRGVEFQPDTLRSDPPPAALVPVVLNQTAAKELFPDVDPLGRRIRQDQRILQVIGVVSYDWKMMLLNRPIPTVFLPLTRKDLRQAPAQGTTVVLRTRTGMDVAAVKRELRAIDSRLTLFHQQTLLTYLDEVDRIGRLLVAVYLPLGLFGLLLACLGLAGVTAQAVERRRKEIGIRMALGARREQLLRLLMGEGVVMVAIGAAAGFAFAYAISRVLAALWAPMAQVLASTAGGPALTIGIPLLLICLAAIACYVPARRSSTADPLVALREE